MASAQARGDMEAARCHQYLLYLINERVRLNLRARKSRKHQAANMRSDMNNRNPSSDAE